jgi:hypothetical protein
VLSNQHAYTPVAPHSSPHLTSLTASAPLVTTILFTNQPIQIKSFGPGELAKSNHSGSADWPKTNHDSNQPIIHTITPTKISDPRAMARAKHPVAPLPLALLDLTPTFDRR